MSDHELNGVGVGGTHTAKLCSMTHKKTSLSVKIKHPGIQHCCLKKESPHLSLKSMYSLIYT